MAFEIHTAEGVAIPINTLDEEAALFWEREVRERYYAAPKPFNYDNMNEVEKAKSDQLGNWFDVIGWNIAHQGNYTRGWNNVINTMMSEQIGQAVLGKDFSIPNTQRVSIPQVDGTTKHLEFFNDKTESDLYWTLEFFKPYLNLIRHWEAKGYIPVKV